MPSSLILLLIGLGLLIACLLVGARSVPTVPTPTPTVTPTPTPIIPGAFLLDTFQVTASGPLEGHVADTGQTWTAAGSNTSLEVQPGFVQTTVASAANEIPLVFYTDTSDNIHFELDFENLNVAPCSFFWALVNPQGDGIGIQYDFIQGTGVIELTLRTVTAYVPSGPVVAQITTFSILATNMVGVWNADGTFDLLLSDNSTLSASLSTPASFAIDRFYLQMDTTDITTSFQISRVQLYSTAQPYPPTALKCLVDDFVESSTTLLTGHVAEAISSTPQPWTAVGPPYDALTINIGAPQNGVRKTGVADAANLVNLVNYDPTVDTIQTVLNLDATATSELIYCLVNPAGTGLMIHLSYDLPTQIWTMYTGSITTFTVAVNIANAPYNAGVFGPLTTFHFNIRPGGLMDCHFNGVPTLNYSFSGLPDSAVLLFDHVFLWFSSSVVGANYLTSIDSQIAQL